jgi:hypothetical protein
MEASQLADLTLDDGDLDLIDSTPEDKEEAAKAVQSSRSGFRRWMTT